MILGILVGLILLAVVMGAVTGGVKSTTRGVDALTEKLKRVGVKPEDKR